MPRMITPEPAPVRCRIKGCSSGKDPIWCPVLIIHAPRRLWGPGYAPIRARLGLRVCDDCRDALELEDILQQFWTPIVGQIVQAGRAAPDRALSGLDFDLVDVDEDPMTPFRSDI